MSTDQKDVYYSFLSPYRSPMWSSFICFPPKRTFSVLLLTVDSRFPRTPHCRIFGTYLLLNFNRYDLHDLMTTYEINDTDDLPQR